MVGVDGCGWVRLGVGESGGSWRWCGRGVEVQDGEGGGGGCDGVARMLR